MSDRYYIAKGSNTLGPCSLDDVRNFVAYGSLKRSDLVRREDEDVWMPLDACKDIFPEEGKPATEKKILPRRRVARYRDYDKVPECRRAGVVIKGLVTGFLFFPPSLWRAAVPVFQDRVFRRAKDEHGYLRIWPRWMEVVVAIMLVVNAITWWAGLTWVWHEAGPIVHQLATLSKDAISDFTRWLNEVSGAPPR